MEIINPVPASGGSGITESAVQALLNSAFSDVNGVMFGIINDSAPDEISAMIGDGLNFPKYAALGNELYDTSNTKGAIELIFKPQALPGLLMSDEGVVQSESIIYAFSETGGGSETNIEVGIMINGAVFARCTDSSSDQWHVTSDSGLISAGNVYQVMVVQNGDDSANPVVYLNGTLLTMTDTDDTAPDAWYPDLTFAMGPFASILGAGYSVGDSAAYKPFFGTVYRHRIWNCVPPTLIGSPLGSVPYEYVGGMMDNHLTGDALVNLVMTGEFSDNAGSLTWTNAASGVPVVSTATQSAANRTYAGKSLKRYRLTYTISGAALGTTVVNSWQLTNSFAGTAVDLPDIADGTFSVEFTSSANAHESDFVLSLSTDGGAGGDTFTITFVGDPGRMSLQQIGCLAEFNPDSLNGLCWLDNMHKPGDEVEKYFSMSCNSSTSNVGGVRTPTEERRSKPVLVYQMLVTESDWVTSDDVVPDGYFVSSIVTGTVVTPGGVCSVDIQIGGVHVISNVSGGMTGLPGALGSKEYLVLDDRFYTNAQEYEEILISAGSQAGSGVWVITMILERCN